ncbi:MAG: GNAT family N-acetyltransferase [Pleurocapsa sp.]
MQVRGAIQAAKICYQKAVAQEPNNAIAHGNLGLLYQESGNLGAARQAYEKALKLNSEDTTIFYRLIGLYTQLCDWDIYPEMVTELVQRTKAHLKRDNSSQLLPLTLSFFDLDLELHQAVAIHYAQVAKKKVSHLSNKIAIKGGNFNKTNKDKIRLGYVSADFRSHAVGYLIQDLFKHHDRDRFEVYCYSLVNTEDEITAKVRSQCNFYTEIAFVSTCDIAQKISDDSIDILIDMAGYTTYSRPEIFALQPAPIQCSYLGFPGTMGADFIQYILADEQLITPSMASHFREEVVYLPHALVSSQMAVSSQKLSRKEFNLPTSSFVFCCFNRPHKISPQVFSTWMNILRQVPNSVLWLYSRGIQETEANLIKEARKAGIDSSRLIFAGKLPHAEYLARYQVADLFLDTFYYNAGATAIGAWQVGLPTLTLAGNSFAGRMGASIAHAAQQPQFVCQTVEEYQQKAIYWGTHSQELKQKCDRDNLPLFDLAKFEANLESVYQQIWQKQSCIPAETAKYKPKVNYKILDRLSVESICQMDELTYPRMKNYWKYKQQQGQLIGILATNGIENLGLIITEITEDSTKNKQAQIISFLVLPQHRHQGIGEELIKSLSNYLQPRCQQITINYQDTEITKTALEPILARQKWRSPETTFALFQTDRENITQAPWLYKYSLPNSFSIFPWIELTFKEKAEYAQRCNYPPSLSPLTKDPRLESLNSLGLRYGGKVIGWCLTHRINAQTIRYSTMYVEPQFQKLGRGISLVAEAIKKQLEHKNIPYFKWSVAAENQAMLSFSQRHLVPYCTFVSESRCAVKDI